MGVTPVYGFPYPALTDSPNGPAQIQALAEAVESSLQAEANTRSSTDTTLTNSIAAILQARSGLTSIATNQNTTSTTFVDLATVGPQVTVTSVGTRAVAIWSLTQFTTVGSCASAVAVSGATTIAAADFPNGFVGSDGGRNGTGWAYFVINPGVNTYTMKYRVSSGTGSFLDRRLMVWAP